MENKRHKILVLSDLKSDTYTMLKSTVGLAKMLDGNIDLFHVKKPTDIVGQESQLSAIRNINQSYTATGNEIQELTDAVFKNYGVGVSHKYAFGNVKHEISEYIQNQQPDVIVIGKRQPKSFGFVGDNITDFVIKNYDGVIMIVDDKNTIEPEKEFALGFLNSHEELFEATLSKRLKNNAKKPLRSFQILKSNAQFDTERNSLEKDIVEYVFEKNDNTINSLGNYLSKNQINLLYIDRTEQGTKETHDAKSLDMNAMISKLKVSFLISSNQHTQI
ncbi:MAG: universal stress protein [Algicola sp.]|nr:universal stress protein [Algicola sp.]